MPETPGQYQPFSRPDRKWKTTFRLRQREQIEGRTLQNKTKKNDLRAVEVAQKGKTFLGESPTNRSASRPSLPKPLYSTSNRPPTATPISPRGALRHPVPHPCPSCCSHGSPRSSLDAQMVTRGAKMEALSPPDPDGNREEPKGAGGRGRSPQDTPPEGGG